MSADAIPFFDLRAGHAELQAELDAAWRRVTSSGRFILGEELERFEDAFAAYCDVPHCVGVASGLAALTLALAALGIGPGDEVIVPGHTFIATWLAVGETGASVVPVDVDWTTCNIDPARVESAITPRTRAIIPVHLYGQPAAMEAIGALAQRHGLAVIEDAAQAHGARHAGVRVGGLGTAAAFSFYPSKNLGAFGDAGAVVTRDPQLADRVRRLRNYGALRKHDHELRGTNARLDELQAAVLRVKLGTLDRDNARRAHAAERYRLLLEHAALTLPGVPAGVTSSWHLFVVRSPMREQLRAALAAAGIETLVHYPTPPHLQPAYAALGLARGALPVAERICAEALSLPMWPQITPAQQERVAGVLSDALDGGS